MEMFYVDAGCVDVIEAGNPRWYQSVFLDFLTHYKHQFGNNRWDWDFRSGNWDLGKK